MGRIVKDVILVVGFFPFIALFARLSLHLPFTSMPVTRQTFAALLTCAALSNWRGAGATMLCLYVPGLIHLSLLSIADDMVEWGVYSFIPDDQTQQVAVAAALPVTAAWGPSATVWAVTMATDGGGAPAGASCKRTGARV